jgi:hypothetical protein
MAQRSRTVPLFDLVPSKKADVAARPVVTGPMPVMPQTPQPPLSSQPAHMPQPAKMPPAIPAPQTSPATNGDAADHAPIVRELKPSPREATSRAVTASTSARASDERSGVPMPGVYVKTNWRG